METKKQVERYAVSFSLHEFDLENGAFGHRYNGFTHIGKFTIDGEEELIKFMKHYNDQWYNIIIDNCGLGEFEYTAEMAIKKVEYVLKYKENEKDEN